jgi:uncharacterized protein (DUF1499 family)
MRRTTVRKKRVSGITDLLQIMAALRAPQGCPWDREQDHRSIRMHAVEEAYELVEEIVRKLKWKTASSDPPTVKPLKGGVLEATDLTPVIGFPDDVIIRVEGSATRSRIDLRSSSRFGVADGGQNATRVRKFLAELQSRTDASGAPIMAGRRGWRSAKRGAPVKKVKGGDPQKVESRNKRDRAQSSAQRGRGQKETLR